MEKAYDLKALGEKLTAAGLPVAKEAAEAAAGKMYIAVKEWFAESAALSSNPFDDMVVPFFAQVDVIVLPKIDKIDGEVG